MKKRTKNILFQSVWHRSWPIPKKSWSYYQEWNHALFLHWKVDPALLQPFIPAEPELDLFEGESWKGNLEQVDDVCVFVIKP